MIGIKGLEEGKNGITLIEDKVVMWQKKTLCILPGLKGILSLA